MRDEREIEILKILAEQQSAGIGELARRLFVSEPTVRRCLNAMADKKLVIRTHGGAIINALSPENNISFQLRDSERGATKAALCESAAHLIHDGNVIFLDASTTAYRMIPFLKAFNDLIVVTSGIKTAYALSESDVSAYCTGGRLLRNSLSLVGSKAVDAVGAFNADLAFFSTKGISPDACLCDTSNYEIDVRQAMLRHAKQSVLLIDGDKLDKTYCHNICSVSEITHVYCDVTPPPAVLSRIKNFHLVCPAVAADKGI